MTWENDMFEIETHLIDAERSARECVLEHQSASREWWDEVQVDVADGRLRNAREWQRASAEHHANGAAALERWVVADTRLRAIRECKRRFASYRSMWSFAAEIAGRHGAALSESVGLLTKNEDAFSDFNMAMRCARDAMGIR